MPKPHVYLIKKAQYSKYLYLFLYFEKCEGTWISHTH